MKVIAISAVTAGGKTTVVNELKKRLPNSCALHFDDYSFEGEVHDFHRWVLDVALARHILWDMGAASGDEIRNNLEMYLRYARIAFVQMHIDILPTSDYVVDGMKSISDIADEILSIVNTMSY